MSSATLTKAGLFSFWNKNAVEEQSMSSLRLQLDGEIVRGLPFAYHGCMS